MPHDDLPLPSLTDQIPYDAEIAIDRLRDHTLATSGALETATNRLDALSDAAAAAQAALDRLTGGEASLLVATLETTTLRVTDITLAGFTPESVLFVGPTGLLAEDPPNFTWDSTTRQLEARGALALPGILRLTTAEPTVIATNVLGRLEFQAPVETSGGTALLVGAHVAAVADGTFTAVANPTALVFATAAAGVAAEQMRLTSAGRLGLNIVIPQDLLHVGAGNLRLDNARSLVLEDAGGTGRSILQLDAGDDLLIGATTIDDVLISVGSITDAITIKQTTGHVGLQVTLPDTQLSLPVAEAFGWFGRARLRSPADGQVTLLNAAETGFERLQLGGTSSSFPALIRSGSELRCRLADNSAAADFVCARISTGLGFTEVHLMNQDIETTDNVQFADLRATGAVRFGTHTALGAETLSGFITITDDGGASRKLAVIS